MGSDERLEVLRQKASQAIHADLCLIAGENPHAVDQSSCDYIAENVFRVIDLPGLLAENERVRQIINDEAGLSDYHASRATLNLYDEWLAKARQERDAALDAVRKLRAALNEIYEKPESRQKCWRVAKEALDATAHLIAADSSTVPSPTP